MGNLSLSTGLFSGEAAPSEQGRFKSRKISRGITYYYGPCSNMQTCPAKDPAKHEATPHSPSAPEDPSSSSSSHSLPDILPQRPEPQRPLLLFLSWLGAHPSVASKYTDSYLERGMDVLLVQSSAVHFLWPRWGLEYGLEVLRVLEEPEFRERPVLVYASSIGGYTFTQILTHVAQSGDQHAGLARRVKGHIYDSLVAGTLEHMATGLGKTLVPRLEGLVKSTAMLYFWLFKRSTADFYHRGVQVFHDSPITAPALFLFCENDALCDPLVIERIMASWRGRGVAVQSRRWKESVHAAHMRCHPEDYRLALEGFLKTLPLACLNA